MTKEESEFAFGIIDLSMITAMVVAGLAVGYLLGFHTAIRDADLIAHRANTSAPICETLGGVLDGDDQGSTICLFTCTVPP